MSRYGSARYGSGRYGGMESLEDNFHVPVEILQTYNTRIKIGSIDLWSMGLVDEFPIIEYYKSFDRDRIFLNELSISATNKDNLFSLENNRSIFKNINWRGQSVKLYDIGSSLIWDGKLYNIIRNHSSGTASLISQNSLYEYRYSKVEYTSSDWETGAEAVKNILDFYGITNYNENSINMSNGVLDDADCLLKVTVTASDKKNLSEVLEEIAKFCNADVFDYNGKIYFNAWRNSNLLIPKSSINDYDILEPPSVEVMDKLIKNDYSIKYNGDAGIPATDSLNNNIGELSRKRNGTYSFDLSGSSIVLLKDLTSAVYVGEQAMKRTHRCFSVNPQGLAHISFSITMDSYLWLDLNTIFKFTFEQESWTDKLFEVYKIKYDYNTRQIGLECFELGS
jgi:hypothetical protein